MKDKIKSGLERLVKKYGPLAGVTAFATPLHEGLHAVLAKLLPGIGCSGIMLNENSWYAKPLSYITLGFYKAAELPQNVGGYAEITSNPGFFGNLGKAIVAAGPEIATMTLGFYWIKKAINNIREKGERLYSIACAYSGMVLCSTSSGYLTSSSLAPSEGSDHKLFTEAVLDLFYLPSSIAPYLTFAGAAAMVAAALYFTSKLPDDSQSI